MDDKAKRMQALEERKRKLEELKRQKEAGSTLSSASAAIPVPIASASGAQSAAAIAAAAIAAAAPPSAAPVPQSFSLTAAAPALLSAPLIGPASAASLDPLINNLLSAPLLDTPEADELSRQKRIKQLAAVPGVVQLGVSAQGGSTGVIAGFSTSLERCETGIQTEAEEDAAAARLVSAAASGEDSSLAAAAARGRVLDDGSAASIFRQPQFGSFLSSAAGRLEAAMASNSGSGSGSSSGPAAAAGGQADGSTSLQRLFRGSADSASGAAGAAGRDEGASGFSSAVTVLDSSAASAASAAAAHSSAAPAAVAAPGAAALAEAHGGAPAATTCSAVSLAALRGCPVSDLAWSAAAPGTLAVAYGASQGRGGALDFATALSSSGAGGGAAAEPPAVLIWNTQRPDAQLAALSLGSSDFAFGSGSGSGSGSGFGSAVCLGGDVTALRFHPHSPHLLLAGTSMGQVLAWDLRAPQAVPVAASGFSPEAHLGPVAALMVAGSAAGSSLLSLSGDGRACVWGGGATGLGSGDPISSSRLTQAVAAAPGKDGSLAGGGSGLGAGSGTPGVAGAPAAAGGAQREAAASCAAFSAADPARLFVGGQEGALYTCQFSGAGVAVQGRVPAHYACVSAVSAHPSRDVPLLLSSSFDGTVKLWNTELKEPALLFTFDGPLDYATDVAWSPSHPAVFAYGDLAGVVRVHHVLRDPLQPAAMHVPAISASSGGGAVSRLRFSPDGAHLAVGDVTGAVRILTPSAEFVAPVGRGEDAAHVASRWSRPE